MAAVAAEDVTEHVTEVEIGGVNLLENPCLTFKRRRCTGRDEVDVDIIIACYGVYSAYQFVLINWIQYFYCCALFVECLL